MSALTPIKSDAIWLPGKGMVSLSARAAAKAVEEYDPDLILGKHAATDDWVVFIKNGPGGQPFPVFGLGKELPGPDEIKRRLYQADTKRRGTKIVAEVERRNEQRRREAAARASDAAGEVAEAYDWALRKQGAHPFPRVFVPAGV